jgi:hypothetical protein
MADRLRQLRQFIVGVRTLKTLKICLRLRFGRWAAEGIGLCVLIDSHSTINDTMPLACRQSLCFSGTRPVLTRLNTVVIARSHGSGKMAT